MADLEQKIETEAGEDDVGHPSRQHGREHAAAAQCDGDRVSRPIAKSHDEGLPDAHSHTASADAASPQAQGDAHEDHDDGDEGKCEAAIVVREQSGK